MSLTKITVRKDVAWFPARPWYAHCAYCGRLGVLCVSWDGAMWEADQHANAPCDGIVLARLVDRLRYRRDGYERALRVNLDRGDLHTAAAYRMVVSNIDHDIQRAVRCLTRRNLITQEGGLPAW